MSTSRSLEQDLVIQLLEFARWAPSGDNSQPWRVSPTREGLEFGLAEEPLAFLDTGGAASIICLGAFTETFALAATGQGLATEIFLQGPTPRGAAVTLSFPQRATLPADPLCAQIKERCTNRRLYAPGSCSEEERRRISAQVERFSAVELTWVVDELPTVAQAVALADKVRMAHRQCHVELHQKIKWTAAQAEADPTGFFVDTLEVNSFQRFFFKLTRGPGVFRALDPLLQISSIGAAYSKRQVLSSGAVGLIAVEDNSVRSLLEAGMALQRAWLQATALGLSMQVMAIVPLFIRRLAAGGEGFDARQKKKIEAARSVMASLKGTPAPEKQVLMFRLGRAAPPTARAGRLPVASIIERKGASAPLPEAPVLGRPARGPGLARAPL